MRYSHESCVAKDYISLIIEVQNTCTECIKGDFKKSNF